MNKSTMDTGTATDPTRSRWGVRYRDDKGKTRERYFSTDEALQGFLDRGYDSGTVTETLSFTDPETEAQS